MNPGMPMQACESHQSRRAPQCDRLACVQLLYKQSCSAQSACNSRQLTMEARWALPYR